jgi:hypothetical protein
MSLLPDSATFHEQVEACFVAYRGHGVSLSPKDVALVDVWADAQVPFEVVARGIRKAAEAAAFTARNGEVQLQSLAACRRAVEAEVKKYRKISEGRTEAAPEPAPFHLVRFEHLQKLLKGLARERPELGIERWRARLPEPRDFTAGSRTEELVLALLLRARPFAERLECLREASKFVQKSAPASKDARREALRFQRAALVRLRLELPAFW